MIKVWLLLRFNEFLIIEEWELKKLKYYWIFKFVKIIYFILYLLGFLIKDWEMIIVKVNMVINFKKF